MHYKVKKHFVYILLIFIFFILIVEFCPYVLSPVIFNHPFSRKQIKSELFRAYDRADSNIAGKYKGASVDEYLGEHTLHPYLGFVNHPDPAYNKYCFPGPDPVIHCSPDKINICLMGGSVAVGLYNSFKNTLIDLLKRSDYFKGKEFNIVLLAAPGYKQPQQLITLNYFLSLGACYDIVINLDGFNEVVLPFADNLPYNVHPSYPRNWNFSSRKGLNRNVQLILLKQLEIHHNQISLAAWFIQSPLQYSNFALLFWSVLNRNLMNELFRTEGQLREALKLTETDYQATGPAAPFSDTIQYFTEQAQLWERSSVLMGSLGKSMGFEYFHFLQPNQYYKNSKPLTGEELETAYEHSPFSYKTAVQIGYPLLIKTGNQLAKKINYHDLTMMFKNEERSVYHDKCCHFNKLGYQLITEEILQCIIEYYDKEEPALKTK